MFRRKTLKLFTVCVCLIFTGTTLAIAQCPNGYFPDAWCPFHNTHHEYEASSSSSDDSDDDSDDDRTTFMDVLTAARNDFVAGSDTVETFMNWVSDSWNSWSWTSPPTSSYSSICDWCLTEHSNTSACQGP